MMNKKPIITVLAVACILGNVQAGAAQSWQDAYANFLRTDDMVKQSTEFFVCDLDFDGIPEIFLGADSLRDSPLYAYTYKNGKVTEISVPSLGSSTHLKPSDIREAQLLRHHKTGAFLWVGANREYDVFPVETWETLVYSKNTLYQYPFVSVGLQDNYMDFKSWYTELSWTFKDESMDADAFKKRVSDYFSLYTNLGNFTVGSTTCSVPYRNGDEMQSADIQSQDATGHLSIDPEKAIALMNTWTPKIVLSEQTAKPQTAKLLVDGQAATVPAVELFGNNYVRLRDLAALLKDTDLAFDVQWNDTSREVELTKGVPYASSVGGAITGTKAKYSTQNIKLGSAYAPLTTYLVNGENVVRLRDLAEVIGFAIDWDAANACVLIETTKA